MTEISSSIRDRQFFSHGGKTFCTVHKVVSDVHTNKIAQLKELELSGVDITTLNILKNNRGRYLVTNNGSLLYRD